MKRQRTAWLLALWLGLGLGISNSLHAETLYVTDHILLGLHQGPAADSPVIKSLPSGSALEVLQKRGDFTQVRSIDGTEGWVSTAYLMADQPAHSVLKALTEKQENNRRLIAALNDQLQVRQQDLKTARARLATAEKKLAQADKAPPADEKALADAQAELKTLRDQVAKLKAEAKSLPAVAANTSAVASNVSSLQSLQEKNLELNARIRLAIANLNGEKAPSAKQLASLDPGLPIWYLGLLAAVLLFGFIGGMLWLDYRYRKRHGGFRI